MIIFSISGGQTSGTGLADILISREESLAVTTHNSTIYIEKLTMDSTIAEAGDYLLLWSYGWNADTTVFDFNARIQQDDTTDLMIHNQEVKDANGIFESTGSDQRHLASGHIPMALSPGVYQFDIDFKSQSATAEVSMWDARLTLIRMN